MLYPVRTNVVLFAFHVLVSRWFFRPRPSRPVGSFQRLAETSGRATEGPAEGPSGRRLDALRVCAAGLTHDKERPCGGGRQWEKSKRH